MADIYCFSHILQHFSELDNYSKSLLPNVFRWILQIQSMEGFEEVLKILGFSQLDELPFGLQPAKPKGVPKAKQKKVKQPKKKKQKKKKEKPVKKTKDNSEKPVKKTEENPEKPVEPSKEKPTPEA